MAQTDTTQEEKLPPFKVATRLQRHFGTAPISNEEFTELMKPIGNDKAIAKVTLVRAQIRRVPHSEYSPPSAGVEYIESVF